MRPPPSLLAPGRAPWIAALAVALLPSLAEAGPAPLTRDPPPLTEVPPHGEGPAAPPPAELPDAPPADDGGSARGP